MLHRRSSPTRNSFLHSKPILDGRDVLLFCSLWNDALSESFDLLNSSFLTRKYNAI